MDIDSMKYAELQKLAKKLGLKANMKADKLQCAIKQHYEQEKAQDQCQNVLNEAPENPAKELKCTPASAFVSTRRGKGAGAKRKISEVAASKSDFDEAPTAPEETIAPVGAGSAKRKSALTKTDENDGTSLSKKKEHQKEATKPNKIPRLQKKAPLNPVTPNFKKLHEAQFNKMESIDSYVQRKTKQMETYKTTVKELKKPKQTRTSLFSPAPASKTQAEERRRHTLQSASKAKAAPQKDEVSFKPTVLSTRRINVRFSEATKDNEHKQSLLKTPARMSPCVATSTPKEMTKTKANVVKTFTPSATKIPGPFVFTGDTSTTTTPGKKTSFDLKASLARPLSYKPHTGKLKPFGETKENPPVNKSMTLNSHQKNYKQHQVLTREDRRAKHTEDRKQKKNDLLGARRGLVMM